MSSSQMIVESTFNDVFNRPPTFCEDCGELLDFEIIINNNVRCQKCGGETPLGNIKNHFIESEEKFEMSKEWMNKLKNIYLVILIKFISAFDTFIKNSRTFISTSCLLYIII